MHASFLILVTLFVSTHAVARADQVDARVEYLVDGEPVVPGRVRGTVAIARMPEGFVPEEGPLAWQVVYGAYCTGVLIHPQVVLTAAHCLEDCTAETLMRDDGELYTVEVCRDDPISADQVYVLAGWRTDEDLWRAEAAGVSDLRVPEEYLPTPRWWEAVSSDATGVTADINDIALLRLDAPITVVDPVPILLDDHALVSSPAIVTGYGRQAPPPEPPLFEEDLLNQEAYVSRLNETSATIEAVTEEGILTANPEETGSACLGDSGGPLYVFRGGQPFVAGVLSRFRGDTEVPACLSGLVYTSIPGRVDWILEQAPEAAPSYFTGGGCSASNAGAGAATPLSGVPAFLVALLMLGVARRRPEVALALLVLVGCGADSATSLCTGERDPLGWYCGEDARQAYDLETAVELAHAEVADLEGAILWGVFAAELTPDGESQFWHVTFHVPETDQARTLVVSEEGAADAGYSFWNGESCVATAPLRPFDSRRIAHDAVPRFEADLGRLALGSEHLLAFYQDHPCAAYGLQHMRNVVRLQLLDYEWRFHMVAYDDDGQFLGAIGPCWGPDMCEW